MPEELKNSIGEYLSGLGKTQLRIAETEKYAHVTLFPLVFLRVVVKMNIQVRNVS